MSYFRFSLASWFDTPIFIFTGYAFVTIDRLNGKGSGQGLAVVSWCCLLSHLMPWLVDEYGFLVLLRCLVEYILP